MKSRASPKFWQMYHRLPADVQRIARKQYDLFETDPSHPSLKFKKVSTRHNAYSVRITDDYRAVGGMDENGMLWVWIGPHAEYDRLLKNL